MAVLYVVVGIHYHGDKYYRNSGSYCNNCKISAFDLKRSWPVVQWEAMIVAMQKGIARGIFSNEAGLGSAPIAAAAAQTKEPARQGLVSMTGTFIDTIVICTMTGLSIVHYRNMEYGTGRCGSYHQRHSSRDFRSRTVVASFVSDDLSGILCIYHDSRMGLLRRTMPGISV